MSRSSAPTQRRQFAPPSLSYLLRLAGPIVAAQMCFFGIHTTDTILAGRMGAEVLAAIALGGTFMMLGLTFLMGFGLAVAPAIAHRYGAGVPKREIRQVAGSALWLCVGLWSVCGILLWVLPGPLLQWLDVEPAMRLECQRFLRAISFGMPFLGVFFSLRNVMEALGHSRPVMWLGVAALLLNIPLDLLFMYGWGPIPRLGAMGCGIATALVDAALAAGMFLIFWREPGLRPFRPRLQAHWVHIKELLGLGGPIAVALASEHGIFAIGGFLMARFGAEIMGASQVALNLTGMTFMVALGLSQAASVLVGHAAGRGDAQALHRAGALAYQTVTAVALLVAMALLLFPRQIVALYTSEPAVAGPASQFLQVAGIFHLFDALQAMGAGCLRGLKDTPYVMKATTLAYWGVGGAGFWWFFVQQASAPVMVWYVYLMALAAAALLLGLRFWQQVARRRAGAELPTA